MKYQNPSRRRAARGAKAGFTLIELMVVLVIIAVFAALAAPSIIEVHRRNRLTELLQMVERSASQVRNLAMQTRRGAVLEMAEGRMWINTLSGSDCWSTINARCMHNVGQDATDSLSRYVELTSEYYTDSDAYMCGAQVATMTGSDCALDVTLTSGDPFALCYSGTGDLYLRSGADTATLCDGTGPPTAVHADWVRSCAIAPESGTPFNGAVLYFNRFDEAPANCDAVAVDVMRGVHVPAGATPYSRVEI